MCRLGVEYKDTEIDKVPGVSETLLKLVVYEGEELAAYIKNNPKFGVDLPGNKMPTVEQVISFIGYKGGNYAYENRLGAHRPRTDGKRGHWGNQHMEELGRRAFYQRAREDGGNGHWGNQR